MTTENPVRKALDAQNAKDEAWDDLHRLYLECRALSVQPSQVTPLLKDQELLSKLDDAKELVNKARVLSKDVTEHNNRLQLIHNKHADRSGGSQSNDELMQVLAIGEEYREWMEGFQIVVMPTVVEIMQQFEAVTTVTTTTE